MFFLKEQPTQQLSQPGTVIIYGEGDTSLSEPQ